MKTTISIILFFVMLAGFSQEQANVKPDSKSEEIKIQTSAQCQMCKDRIEGGLSFEKGIKSAILNLEDKVLTVKFRTGKTDADKIKKAVSKLGYDADDVAADPEAYEKLPACCKKGGHDPK